MPLMAVNLLRYDQMIEEALRGVVRRALRTVVESGLPGNHHFYITFKTTAPGVELAPRLKEKYPDEMTIVLQYQFWGLAVETEQFEVTLSFNEVPERLVVPFAAITAFADPAAKFGLQFQQETTAAPEEASSTATGTDAPAAPRGTTRPPAAGEIAAAGEANPPSGEAKIVTLDSFRRK
jgi:hypothetical protein